MTSQSQVESSAISACRAGSRENILINCTGYVTCKENSGFDQISLYPKRRPWIICFISNVNQAGRCPGKVQNTPMGKDTGPLLGLEGEC